MRTMDGKAHLAEAFRWSRETEVAFAEMLALGLGMAGPAALGAVLGHLPPGLMAAFGGLAAGGVGMTGPVRARLRALGGALWPVAIAAALAACIAGHGWPTDAGLVLLAGAAATLGGYSRPMAVAAAPTPAQKFRRWRRSLAGLAGWQYALRLMLCLAVAGLLRGFWPEHHMHWVALTVALLSQRQIEAVPVKATQRALGTALGVVASGLLVLHRPPDWGLVLGVGLLAAARPLLKTRNYLAYSAIMTPLIILVMDAGQPLDLGVLGDRLAATLLGAALVIATNLAFAALPKAA